MRVFDAHVHMFPDPIASRTVEALGGMAGITPAFDGTRAGLLASMERAGIAAALNCPVATKPEQVESINCWAAEQTWPAVSLGTVHPDCTNIQGALDAVARAGLRGIKLHPEFQQFTLDDTRLTPVWRGCGDLGLVVVLHCGGDMALPPPYRSSPASVRAVLDAYPQLRLVAAHFGGWRMWDAVVRELIGRDVYLDLSYTLDELADERIVTLTRRHGVDRVVFGTDAPWRDQAAELARFLVLPFTPAERDAILWENAATLFEVAESAPEGVAAATTSPQEPDRPQTGGLTMARRERDRLLALAEEALAKECRVDRFRGTGPGGQKRNKTDSAVRVTHTSTGLAAASDETRSQIANRRLALRKLRQEIALQCRALPPAPWSGTWCPGQRDPLYLPWLATVLDVLEAQSGRVSEAAASFGVSTGRFVRDLESDPRLWQAANACRRRHHVTPLRSSH